MGKSRVATPKTYQRESTPGTVFSFGDPEPVLSNQLTDYLGVFATDDGKYYTPPVSLKGLAKVTRANAHHGACLYFKRNLLLTLFKPSPALGIRDLKGAALDFVTFGNCYFQKISNRAGMVQRLQHVPAINLRKMVNYENRYLMLTKDGDVEFAEGEIIHLAEYDLEQQIYGIPEYLGGLQSLLLNEDATLFRRKYYKNGAHMGFIFYTNDPSMDEDTEKDLEEQIKQSKGVGNFRSLFVHIPNGSEKAVQIIPVGDISQRDEFERIKNISRNDIISAHRMRPELAGIMPENAGSSGDIEKINRVHIANEIVPLTMEFLTLNAHLPAHLQIGFNTDDNNSH